MKTSQIPIKPSFFPHVPQIQTIETQQKMPYFFHMFPQKNGKTTIFPGFSPQLFHPKMGAKASGILAGHHGRLQAAGAQAAQARR